MDIKKAFVVVCVLIAIAFTVVQVFMVSAEVSEYKSYRDRETKIAAEE